MRISSPSVNSFSVQRSANQPATVRFSAFSLFVTATTATLAAHRPGMSRQNLADVDFLSQKLNEHYGPGQVSGWSTFGALVREVQSIRQDLDREYSKRFTQDTQAYQRKIAEYNELSWLERLTLKVMGQKPKAPVKAGPVPSNEITVMVSELFANAGELMRQGGKEALKMLESGKLITIKSDRAMETGRGEIRISQGISFDILADKWQDRQKA